LKTKVTVDKGEIFGVMVFMCKTETIKGNFN